jgi:hypothetical protein
MPTGFELSTGASSCFSLRAKCPVRERPLAIFASPIGIRSMYSFSRKGASDREDGELATSGKS